MGDNGQDFGKVRALLWPIHGFELKKFLPTSLLMAAIIFVYTLVRDLKDTFIQKYAILGGTELISALKLWFVLPMAFVVVIVFSTLVSKFGMRKTFYIVCSFYTIFFAVFAWILFPNADKIHMSKATMEAMRSSWPSFTYYIIPCLGNWAYTMFFIFAETWGTLAVSSLFWFFANEITKKTEVKRFYALYPLIANIGTIICGTLISSMSKVKDRAVFDHNVKILVSIAAVFCIITMFIYNYINTVVLKDPKLFDPSEVKPKKKKAKVSPLDGLKILATSPYLFLIVFLPLSYGISINLYEGIFKGHMRAALPDPSAYTEMAGRLSQVTGIATITLTFLSVGMLRKFKWRFNALVTPVSMLVLGVAFFCLMFYHNGGGKKFMGMDVPMLAVWIGLLGDAVAKGIKYCLFDTTKSMTFRPLDPYTQAQGQGAVEVIGGRGGKAGGAFITYILLNVISVGSSILSHTKTLFILFILFLLAWIFSIMKLSGMYEQKVKESEQAQKAEQK
jgi:AAA family ATP:ADP antiporter